MSSIHAAAATGFRAAADTYARGRPDYPAPLDAWLTGPLHLGPGRRVLDLGAGTGKFTRRLAATGAQVIAVEPVEAMRVRLSADLPAVTALGGNAEAIPVPNGSVDAVVCAQSFHWFATAAALAEIHRVIAPGGHLGLVWNLRDESVPWVKAIADLAAVHEGDAPRAYTGRWREVFPALGFGPLAETVLPHGHTGPPEQVILDRALSTSFVAALPRDEQDRLAAGIRAIMSAEPALAGKAEVTYPYVTRAYAATRL